MPAQRSSNRPSGRRLASQASGASQSQLHYPIPDASVQAFSARNRNQPQNPGLIFDRFAPDWSGQATLKKEGLEAVREAAERADSGLLRSWNARWEACAQAANAEPFSLKTDWRFIAGLGRKGALEVGFTFHRYGFPILPGSSVKGLARTWALIEVARKVNPPSLKELEDILAADGEEDSEEHKKYAEWRKDQPEEAGRQADDFRAVFGTTATTGRAVFFDAIPSRVPKLELDVMNPHFLKYYQGEAPPTDWQSPVPVYFLTVAPNTEFRFAVGWRELLDDEGQRLRDLAKEWLIGGLAELGAGAKTSAGYGYFVPLPQPTRPTDASPQSAPISAADQPAPTPPAPALSAALALSEELIWRTGTVREYRSESGRGRLVDDETGEELRFDREAIEEKGWSPGRKHKVRYAVVQRTEGAVVVKVRRT